MQRFPERRGKRLVWALAALGIVMFGAAFAMSPLYTLLCAALGIGAPALSAAGAGGIADGQPHRVRIEFDATRNESFPGAFEPRQRSMEVHPGKSIQTTYRIRNAADRSIVTRAVPGITPARAAPYVRKLECFCFSEQVLGPHEEREMGVVMVLDPALPQEIGTVTLSYTMHAVR